MDEHFDYDPNYFDDAKHTVRLTLGSWKYRMQTEITTGGNCKGADICEHAMNKFVDQCLKTIEESGGFDTPDRPDDGKPLGSWDYVMTDAAGGTLRGEVFGEERECERDIRGMILGAEIIAFGGPEVEAKRARYAAYQAEADAKRGSDE